MKKFFTLLACTFIAASVFASDVTIAFNGNNDYQVAIDGRNISNYNYRTNVINLNNFQPGQHSIAVYRMRNNRGWDNNKLVYSSYFTVRPQYDLFINIAGNGRVAMDERRSGYGNDNGYGRDRDRDYDHDDRGYRNHEGRNEGYDNKRNDNDDNWRRNNNWGNNRYNNAMSDYSFNQLVQRIRSQWFGKFNTAKNAVNNNYMTTYQVRQLMQLFSSDNERLTLAEQAYRNTVDQNNYTQLYDLLSRRSQKELNRFTRDYRY